jgi:type I restriction enzyme S subunit
MAQWEQYALGEVADLCLGKMLDQNKNRGVPTPYLANVNVRWGEFVLDNLRVMRFEAHERDRYGLKYGDIVMCEGGEPGRCAIWKEQVPGMMIQKALHRIRPGLGLDHGFLYYSFRNIGLRRGFDQYFTGATIKHLPGEKLAKVEVPIPPLPIQRRIAGILSSYDDLIENSQRRIKILEEMARRLYREWFVYFRFPGHENCRLVESPLGEIPEGWEVKGLGRVTEITMGLSPKGDTYNEDGLGVPLVNGPVEFDERFTKAIKWTTSPIKVCRQGDLVVCVRGSTTGKYVKSDGTYCLGRGVASLSGAFQAFIDQLYVDQLPILLRQASGSTFPSWTAPQLSGHPVVCPSPVILSASSGRRVP